MRSNPSLPRNRKAKRTHSVSLSSLLVAACHTLFARLLYTRLCSAAHIALSLRSHVAVAVAIAASRSLPLACRRAASLVRCHNFLVQVAGCPRSVESGYASAPRCSLIIDFPTRASPRSAPPRKTRRPAPCCITVSQHILSLPSSPPSPCPAADASGSSLKGSWERPR